MSLLVDSTQVKGMCLSMCFNWVIVATKTTFSTQTWTTLSHYQSQREIFLGCSVGYSIGSMESSTFHPTLICVEGEVVFFFTSLFFTIHFYKILYLILHEIVVEIPWIEISVRIFFLVLKKKVINLITIIEMVVFKCSKID